MSSFKMLHLIVLGSLVISCATQLVGGISAEDASDAKYTEIAWQAVQDKAINGNGRANFFVPLKVISAKVQVVAGQKTILEVVVGESNCATKDMQVNQLSATKCQFKNGGSRELYKVELWEKPWENFKKFTITKTRDITATEQI